VFLVTVAQLVASAVLKTCFKPGSRKISSPALKRKTFRHSEPGVGSGNADTSTAYATRLVSRPKGIASTYLESRFISHRPPARVSLSRFDTGIDGVSALLAGCDKAAGWAMIIDGTHSAAGKDHVDLAEPA
jgi:hypothetical protein